MRLFVGCPSGALRFLFVICLQRPALGDTMNIRIAGRKVKYEYLLPACFRLGPVHTKVSGHVIIHVWNLHKPHYQLIKPYLPVQRGNVTIPNIRVLNAILYVAEHGCKWRGLPSRFGNWHTIYMRMNRWAKSGVLDRVFEQLQRKGIVKVTIEVASLDSTSVKVHPDGTGAAKKTDHSPSASPEADGRPSFIWLPRMIGHP